MEYYNNQLCISHMALTDGIMSAEMIKWCKRENKIEQLRRGCNGTTALFAVDSLPLKYKTEVYKRYPDMQAQAESKPFVEEIVPDGIAMNFFENYKLSDGRNLDPDKQLEYSNNAAILNAFRTKLERANSHRARQGQKRLNKADFWQRASGALPHLADKYPHSLPENARRLQQRFSLYLRGGYEVLVSGKFQNRNAAKVDDDFKESVLIQLIADPRNLSNTQIQMLYNALADIKGWENISVRPIEVIREKYSLLTAGGRLGEWISKLLPDKKLSRLL